MAYLSWTLVSHKTSKQLGNNELVDLGEMQDLLKVNASGAYEEVETYEE